MLEILDIICWESNKHKHQNSRLSPHRDNAAVALSCELNGRAASTKAEIPPAQTYYPFLLESRQASFGLK
jgi:hypothetical protein